MIIVIGAGPAGLAAAEAAARSGEEVTILDSSPRMGGQYWRHQRDVSGYKSERAKYIFEKILSLQNITYLPSSTVWSAEDREGQYQINFLQSGIERSIRAEKIIIATGAYDRSLPYPGWDSPGAMTPGAAQSLLKGNGVVAGKRIVVAGTGPFLLPVASGLAQAGAEIVGLYEANSPLLWLLSPGAIFGNFSKIPELLHYVRELRKYRIRPKFRRAVVKFGDGFASVAKVRSNLSIRKNVTETVACDVVAVGWGFQPDVSLGGILGCAQRIDSDGSVIFEVDTHQASSQRNIWIAGEATGIGGADLSLVEGEIAGLAAAGKKVPRKLLRKRSAKRRFARALQRSYPVGSQWISWLESTTIICRCEEVSSLEICNSVTELGAEDARGAKLFTRAGMGLCQGRVCSRNVSEIVSSKSGFHVTEPERIASSNRPLAAPISLGALADGKSFN